MYDWWLVHLGALHFLASPPIKSQDIPKVFRMCILNLTWESHLYTTIYSNPSHRNISLKTSKCRLKLEFFDRNHNTISVYLRATCRQRIRNLDTVRIVYTGRWITRILVDSVNILSRISHDKIENLGYQHACRYSQWWTLGESETQERNHFKAF